ncbi:hypothetical protein RFI_05949 [Reticulomyxa filosa]|uniref:Peptidase M48 domain-containing protein n=1 Tax=Reticulomyxa filosa TaxID=46433 RepID=X6NYW2_RETFI|nr:hypothetical protein RFI_05949 [Reticulomyxa filosa]|eukprot:ETO31171.1 hypothetical protein RFI_05949 [Reticulomyxa filosa]
MDGSSRSSHSNAFQYGFCGNKRIVLFDTLIQQTNTNEIVAILAHELGHWKHWHTIFQLVMSEIQLFIIFSLFGICYKDRFVVQSPTLVCLLLEFVISTFYQSFGFSAPITIIGLYLYFEFQADKFAVDLGYQDHIYHGLIKIHQENKATLNPDWLFSAYHYSHPPLIQRLQAIRDAKKD